MKLQCFLLKAAILLASSHAIDAGVVYEQDIPGKGRLVCELATVPFVAPKTQLPAPKASQPKGSAGSFFDYRLVWTPEGTTTAHILWEISAGPILTDTGAPPFLPMDACVQGDGKLLIVFRNHLGYYSTVLELGRKYSTREPSITSVVEESLRNPIRVFGAGALRQEPQTGERQLLLEGTSGQELFAYDGSAWTKRSSPPMKSFVKVIPGVGKVYGRQAEVPLPPLPSDRTERLHAQRKSQALQTLLQEIPDAMKHFAYIQQMHRHELLLVKDGSTEPISLFKRTSYFDPEHSRCPTGFIVMDVMAEGGRLFLVFKEQTTIQWAVIDFGDTGVVTKESPRPIISENHHRTYSSAMLNPNLDGKGIRLELRGSAGKQFYRLFDSKRWEAINRDN